MSKSFGEPDCSLQLNVTVNALLTVRSEIGEIPLWDRNSQNTTADSKLLVTKNPSFAYKQIYGSSPCRGDVVFHPRENNGQLSQLSLTECQQHHLLIWLLKDAYGLIFSPRFPSPFGAFPFRLILGCTKFAKCTLEATEDFQLKNSLVMN